jgi:hypothetical protein
MRRVGASRIPGAGACMGSAGEFKNYKRLPALRAGSHLLALL